MKILMVNKFHYIKGGSESYYFALKRLLQSLGHTVVDFSMADEKNFPSPYRDHFVSHVDYEQANGAAAKAKMAVNILYSREAKHKFEELVRQEHPDLVHLHLFQHQISPSILDVIKKYNIPTVYTAHDLKMLCPNYKMMQHGHICEQCRGGHYLACLKNRCVKDSLVKSGISTAEGFLHSWRRSYDAIDRIITPSAFYRTKFLEFGIRPGRVVHIPNFLDTDTPTVNIREDAKQYYLYFGRLSEEKGLDTLLDAFRRISAPLYIVGTGPLEAELKKKASPNITFFGFQQGQSLTDLVGNAKAVILPSEWYENGPYSAIEAMQVGRPVIGADIGGISELVDRNGFLFTSGQAKSLADAIEKTEALTAEQYAAMEDASREMFLHHYTAEAHKKLLLPLYEAVIKEKRL